MTDTFWCDRFMFYAGNVFWTRKYLSTQHINSLVVNVE